MHELPRMCCLRVLFLSACPSLFLFCMFFSLLRTNHLLAFRAVIYIFARIYALCWFVVCLLLHKNFLLRSFYLLSFLLISIFCCFIAKALTVLVTGFICNFLLYNFPSPIYQFYLIFCFLCSFSTFMFGFSIPLSYFLFAYRPSNNVSKP